MRLLNESTACLREQIVESDDLIDAGETDFVRAVSARLPLKIICDIGSLPTI